MDKVAKWNVNLPENSKKWIHMQLLGADRPEDPADGIDGWLHFGLASYLLASNSWTTLGANKVSTNSAPVDFSITSRLGTPVGKRVQLSDNQYGLTRKFNGANGGSLGGYVAVNGDTQNALQFSSPFDMINETGDFVPYASLVTLQPNTGRIFFHQNNYKYVSVITSPTEGSVITTKIY